jgi:hypothetical protein
MEDTLTITLNSKQLDVVANALGMRPYVEVAQLLQEIGRQVQAQQPQTGPQLGPEKANGAGAEALQ